MSVPLDLTFGIEIECLIECTDSYLLLLNGGKTPDPFEIDDLVFGGVYKELLQGGILINDPHNREDGTEPFSRWDLKQDESIAICGQGTQSAGTAHRIPMEIISRVLRPGSSATVEVTKVISLIKKQFNMSITRRTGLHIHVGCGSAYFSLETVKKFAVLILAVGNVLDSLHPTRKDNQFCANVQSVIENREGRLYTLRPAERVRGIYDCNAIEEVVQLMNPKSKRNHAYNFTNLERMHLTADDALFGMPSPLTIEFRQHAGSVNATEILNWAKVTTSLVKWAHEASEKQLEELTYKSKEPGFDVFDLLHIIGREDVVSYYESKA
jgi:hypothetical protein